MIYQKSVDSSQYTVVNRQKSEAGFTMVELMVTMVVFVLAISAASQIFTKLLTQFKQQSKIAETNIEGIVGIDLLRQDIKHAGLGLPWNVTGVAGWGAVPGYTEAADPDYTAYNDAPNEPGAFRSGDGAGLDVAGSDYFVIKSAHAATNTAAGKNTCLTSDGNVRTWSLYTDDLENSDRVIVISPGSTDLDSRSLVVSGGSFNTAKINVSSFAPADNTDVRLVYGISNANATNALLAPFNRSDYYISAANAPHCANGTGVLVKATLDQATGAFTVMPILDCVADMQVIYGMDNDEDGDFESGVGGDAYTTTLAGLTSQQIRTRVKEVQVYILSHEGQKDTNFTFSGGSTIIVGRSAVLGRVFDFENPSIADYTNYRWKVYTISVTTDNLR